MRLLNRNLPSSTQSRFVHRFSGEGLGYYQSGACAPDSLHIECRYIGRRCYGDTKAQLFPKTSECATVVARGSIYDVVSGLKFALVECIPQQTPGHSIFHGSERIHRSSFNRIVCLSSPISTISCATGVLPIGIGGGGNPSDAHRLSCIIQTLSNITQSYLPRHLANLVLVKTSRFFRYAFR